MKRVVKANNVSNSELLETFLRYHDNPDNYAHNRNGFDDMYEILEKYDDSNKEDTVDVAFLKAPLADQIKMVELITPHKATFKEWYYDICQMKRIPDSYQDGFRDAVEALIKEGLLDRRYVE